MTDYLHNSLPESFDNMFIKNNQLPNSRTTRQSNVLHLATSQILLPDYLNLRCLNYGTNGGNNFQKICQDHQ